MTVLSRALARFSRLPQAATHRVRVERGLKIPMRDGAVLLADRYYADVAGGDRAPVLLTRTPYGRGAEGVVARIFAERGYQVVVVSCRGTFGSGGEWYPFFNEQADGHAVLSWIAEQEWFTGALGLTG